MVNFKKNLFFYKLEIDTLTGYNKRKEKVRGQYMDIKRIMVTGATGHQGGAVLRALKNSGHKLYGLSRHLNNEKVKKLEKAGVTMIEGDFHRINSLKKAFRNIDSLFLVGTPYETGPTLETINDINVIDIAFEVGITHLVFSSMANANKNTEIPHFDSKWRVEEYLMDRGIPYTIIAPTFFYENMISSFLLPDLKENILTLPMPKEVKLQCMSLKNLGEFAAMVLKDRERFINMRIDMAEDALNGPMFAESISSAYGRKINYVVEPMDQMRSMSEDMATMFDWFNKIGYSVNIDAFMSRYPEIEWISFSQWAMHQDWSILEERISHHNHGSK